MADLSQSAQAVLDHFLANVEISLEHGIAAALRAAADQVVPEESLHGGDQRWMFERDARQERRKKLLAIAAELEGATRDSLEPNDLSHLSDEEFHALAPQGYHGL